MDLSSVTQQMNGRALVSLSWCAVSGCGSQHGHRPLARRDVRTGNRKGPSLSSLALVHGAHWVCKVGVRHLSLRGNHFLPVPLQPQSDCLGRYKY